MAFGLTHTIEKKQRTGREVPVRCAVFLGGSQKNGVASSYF